MSDSSARLPNTTRLEGFRPERARGRPRALRLMLALLACSTPAAPAWSQANAAPTPEDYAAAGALVEANLRGTVKNAAIEPHWLGGGSFWYARDEADGISYVRFDRNSGRRTPLFDHAALAAAIARADTTKPLPTAGRLGLAGVTLSGDLKQLTGTKSGKTVSCDLVAMSCTVAAPPAGPPTLPSPDGKRALLVRDGNLVVRSSETGRDSALTTDGKAHYAYATLPESSLLTIPQQKGLVLPPMGASWSPDGRFLLASRTDEREVLANPFVEWVPQDGSRRPVYHPVRSPFVGDKAQVDGKLFVFDLTSGRSLEVEVPASFNQRGRMALSGDPIGWSVSRSQVFLLGRTAGSKRVVLFRLDLATAALTPVIDESSPTRFEINTEEYNGPNARVIGDGAEVIWYSTRSGSGQLYRYDAQTGALENPITESPGAVFNLIMVDERRREVYYTAGGREPGRDPYYQHLYKASLDRGAARLLTEPDADHWFPPTAPPLLKLLLRRGDVPPRIDLDAQVFVDTYSTVSTPPVTVLRSTVDGKLVREVEVADASALYAAGWKPPVREKVKAADGVTDLYAVYYAPLKEIGRAKHPVIDAVYGGPQVIVAPKSFTEAFAASNPLGESGLARLGFAMVTVDGRGTPYRDNAFRDAGYPEFTQVAIDDHIAAIRQLAARHPEMDPTRVGIYGWSWGGTFTAQAMLSRPDFYRVGVSGAGVYDYAALYPGFETFTSPPVYADGSSTRTRPDESPSNWVPLDITALAGNLKGRLLLVYGDLDENVPSSQAFRLAAALVKANKRYDLLYLPGRTHAGGGEGYTIQRTWDYFVEHLLQQPPPAAARLTIKGPAAQ